VPVIPGLKAVVAHYAADPGWLLVRPPLVDLAAAQRDALLAELAVLKLEMPELRG
jgi:4-hydroxy-tetrahydrodipicolinate synthase